MSTHKYERPWQVMPAKIIKLALEHAEKKDDFDHQVAYLLLDIGVEAALKVYLVNKKQDVEHIVFPELLKRVKEELSKSGSKIAKDIDDIGYFHGIRNKLYHQGDGVKPTEDNLKRYSDLAKKVIEEIVEVNLETEEKKHLIEVSGHNRDVKDLVSYIESNFKYFQESCAIVAEKTRPAYATREFAMRLRFILENWPDRDSSDLEDRMDAQKERLEKFNELIAAKQTSYRFVDYMLADINHFYVVIALQQTSDKWSEVWEEYQELDKRRRWLLSNWQIELSPARSNHEKVREEFEKIMLWLQYQQQKVDEWINSHLENISRPANPRGYIDIRDILI